MKRMIAGLTVLALAGCSLPQLAATATQANVSPETVATLSAICRHGEPLIAVAAQPGMPASVREIGTFVHGYCGALLAGHVPATTDSNTRSWLQTNIAALRALLG